MNLYEEFKDKDVTVIVNTSLVENKTSSSYVGKIVNQKENFITLIENSQKYFINIHYITCIEF